MSQLKISKITETYQRSPLMNIIDQLNKLKFKTHIVSHQIFNELNFLHFELIYLGFPLIHNCEMIKEVGYMYHQHNINEGSKCLEISMISHDTMNKSKEIKEFLWKYNPNNPEIIKKYCEFCGIKYV